MKTINVITSRKYPVLSQIFEKEECANHTEYRYYPQNDTTKQKLDEFVTQYKREPTIENKKKILEAEKQLLLEEFQNPELTIVRINKSILSKIGAKAKELDFLNWLKLCVANGFYRIISLPNNINPGFTNRDCLILKKAFINLDENNDYGLCAKERIIDSLTWKGKTNIVHSLTQNKKLIQELDSRASDSTRIYEKITHNENYTTKDLINLLTNDYESIKDKKKIKSLIINLLKDKNLLLKKRQIAVWGAGKFKSESAYKIIKEIAKNKNEKDLILREYALHSVAFYVRLHPDEVKKILESVEKENSIFSPLAKILKSKIEGIYHSTENRPFIDKNMTTKDIERFKKLKRKILHKKSSSLNIMQENKLDEGLIEFLILLKKLTKKNFKIGITDETITKIFMDNCGKRIFYKFLDKNQGDFDDATTGLASYGDNPFVGISTQCLNYKHTNVTNHELAHQLQKLLTKQEYRKLKEIYIKSNAKNHPLGQYAATNESEYFACAMDAFLSPYIPHEELIYETNSRYRLMVKDKKMYNFLQKIYNKYLLLKNNSQTSP